VAARGVAGDERVRERLTRITMNRPGLHDARVQPHIVDAVAASQEVSTFIPALAYTFRSPSDRGRGRHEERAAASRSTRCTS